MKNILLVVLFINLQSCSKKTGSPSSTNHAPLASLSSTVTGIDPFTVDFVVTASDADGDLLTYKWDFGDGIVKDGANKETHGFDPGKTYVVKVIVSDGKASPVTVSANINTVITNISV